MIDGARRGVVACLGLLAACALPMESDDQDTPREAPVADGGVDGAIEPMPVANPGPLTGRELVAAGGRAPSVEQGRSGLLRLVPRLSRAPGLDIEASWLAAKNDMDLPRQHREVRDSGLLHTVCEDLVDLRAYEGAGLLPFRWRDRVRERTWIEPGLGAILVRAYATLLELRPEARVRLGDLSQIGCGSLQHGTLVRHVVDGQGDLPATRLLNAARLRHGSVVVSGEVPETTWVDGPARIPVGDRLALHEQVILGWDEVGDDRRLLLRVASRRYHGQDPLRVHEAPPSADALMEQAEKALRRARVLEAYKQRTWSPEGGLATTWLQRWGSSRQRKQVTTLASRKLRTRDLGEATRLSVASWQRKKPRSLPNEVLLAAPGEAPWRSVYEAGHISHLAGRDADIAYITQDNRSHFAVDTESILAEETWLWFRILDAVAAKVGAPLERILVDRHVKRRLMEGLPDEVASTALWRGKVAVVRGHGAHHHIRVSPCDAACKRSARDLLEGLKGLPEGDWSTLVLWDFVERERHAKASAAAKPDATESSTPTPDR